MKKLLLVTSLAGVFIFYSFQVTAQSTCTQTLRTARSTYDQGRLHELPGLLDECLKSGFTQQEKVEAYKLLTLTYIYLEEPTKADASILDLLRTDPYFEINPSADPAEFISLYKTFRTWPIYRVGAKVGVNATSPSISSYVDAVEGASSDYSPGINFQAGLVFEIPLNQKFTLNPELYFQLKSFSYTSELALEDGVKNTSDGKENQTSLSLPVSLQYKIGKSKLNPYVALGVAADYLINANITMNRVRVNATSTQERTFDIKDHRNTINLSAIASAGIKLKLGGGYVVSEVRIVYGLTDINDLQSSFTLSDYLLFDNAYADNIMKINSLSITAGYIYNVFNPKKLKNRK